VLTIQHSSAYVQVIAGWGPPPEGLDDPPVAIVSAVA
jgi:hypothetical protein